MVEREEKGRSIFCTLRIDNGEGMDQNAAPLLAGREIFLLGLKNYVNYVDAHALLKPVISFRRADTSKRFLIRFETSTK